MHTVIIVSPLHQHNEPPKRRTAMRRAQRVTAERESFQAEAQPLYTHSHLTSTATLQAEAQPLYTACQRYGSDESDARQNCLDGQKVEASSRTGPNRRTSQKCAAVPRRDRI